MWQRHGMNTMAACTMAEVLCACHLGRSRVCNTADVWRWRVAVGTTPGRMMLV